MLLWVGFWVAAAEGSSQFWAWQLTETCMSLSRVYKVMMRIFLEDRHLFNNRYSYQERGPCQEALC